VVADVLKTDYGFSEITLLKNATQREIVRSFNTSKFRADEEAWSFIKDSNSLKEFQGRCMETQPKPAHCSFRISYFPESASSNLGFRLVRIR